MSQKKIITASPSALHKWFWGRYFERAMRKAFYRTYLYGNDNLASWIDSDTDTPLVLYCTHGGWWDAAATIVLSLRTFAFDAIGMMEDVQLRKHRFFRKIGMFSISRSDARSSMESLDYCSKELKNHHRVLWMFPQGVLVHQDKRPIECENGLAFLVKKIGKVYLAPVALRYDFLREQRPEMFIRIGVPELIEWNNTMTTSVLTQHLCHQLTHEWDILRDDVVSGNLNNYSTLFKGKMSVEKRISNIKKRIGIE